MEFIYAALIVLVLTCMGSWVAWRQVRLLRHLAADPNRTPEDHRFQKALAIRRLFVSGLMLTLAALLAGTYWFGQERCAAELSQSSASADGTHERPPLNEEDSRFLTRYSVFWLVFGCVLLAVIMLALYDMWAIHSYARRSLRQIRDDRRAMIEEQVAELRRQRNGR